MSTDLQQNYSLSGAFRPLSKLIVCFVMLRGRHRGLPVAIDRAVLLPQEYRKPEDPYNDHSRSFARRQSPQDPGDVSGQKRSSSEETAHRQRVARMGVEVSMQNSRTRSYMEDSEMSA